MKDRQNDPATAFPELALELRQSPLPSPALRRRVLAAVDDILESGPSSAVTAMDGRPWMVAALLVAGLMLAPTLLATGRGGATPERRAVPALAERAIAAGVAGYVLPLADSPPSSPRLASSRPRVDDGGPAARSHDPFHIRRLLEGEF